MNFYGGCQCGKVRYVAQGPRDRASVCYCRMCQRASGGPFMAFVRFQVAQVSWAGTPTVFASSDPVERGFCSACGTPLTYHQTGGLHISVTLNSLDDPAAVTPEINFFLAAKAPWLAHLDELQSVEMD